MSTKAHFSEETWKEEYYNRIKDKKSCRPKIVEKPEMFPVLSKEDIGPLYNLTYDSPISWEQFKPLPEEMKKRYLVKIREKFPGVAKSAIARMMGTNNASINKEIKNLGLEFKGWNKSNTMAFYNHFNLAPYDIGEVKKKENTTKKLREEVKSLKSEIKKMKNSEKDSKKIDVKLLDSFTFTASASAVSDILKNMDIYGPVTITVSLK